MGTTRPAGVRMGGRGIVEHRASPAGRRHDRGPDRALRADLVRRPARRGGGCPAARLSLGARGGAPRGLARGRGPRPVGLAAAPAGQRAPRAGFGRGGRGRERRGRPPGHHEGRAVHSAPGDRRAGGLPLRAPLVRDHRPARLGQDHGARQFRPQVPAGQGPDPRGGGGGRRHALLRLVVHRGRGAHRHGGPLHHPGLEPPGRPRQLAELPGAAQAQPAEAAHQRRPRGDQPGGPAHLRPRRDRGPCGRDPQAAHRAARAPARRLPRLRPLHQGRPRGGFRGVLRPAGRRGAPGGLGGDVPDGGQDPQHDRRGARRVRRPRAAAGRVRARPPPGGADRRIPGRGLRLPEPDGRAQAPARGLHEPDLRADPLPRQRDAARLLLHLRHPAGHPDRPAHRRHEPRASARRPGRGPIRGAARASSSPTSSRTW
jgi:hypothetical protein